MYICVCVGVGVFLFHSTLSEWARRGLWPVLTAQQDCHLMICIYAYLWLSTTVLPYSPSCCPDAWPGSPDMRTCPPAMWYSLALSNRNTAHSICGHADSVMVADVLALHPHCCDCCCCSQTAAGSPMSALRNRSKKGHKSKYALCIIYMYIHYGETYFFMRNSALLSVSAVKRAT